MAKDANLDTVCTAKNNGNITTTNDSGYWQETTSALVVVETCDPNDSKDGDSNIMRCTLADTSYTLTNIDGTGFVTSCGIADATTGTTTEGDIFCSVSDGSSYTWDDATEATKKEECAAIDTVTTSDTYDQIVCHTNEVTTGVVIIYDSARTLISTCTTVGTEETCDYAATGYQRVYQTDTNAYVTYTDSTKVTKVVEC